MTENRIKLEVSRAEMQNDQLFETANELTRLQEQLNQQQEEAEVGIERKRQLLEKEMRSDRALFLKELQEQRNTAIFKM